MRKAFIDEISNRFGIKRTDLLEKDIILHQVLLDMSKNRFFSGNFLFKGGTCLIKHYLGYYRFSEDIDFTWKNQTAFRDMSQKKIKSEILSNINTVGKFLESVAVKRNMDFRHEKHDRKFIEFGSGNKFATFKLWYTSEILHKESFVKIQMNFIEEMIFSPHAGKLKGLVMDEPQKELEFLFPELWKEYSSTIRLGIYDIREILCEKIRTILTRRGLKARDFIDVYLIKRKLGIDMYKLKDACIRKTRFMLEKYERYGRNFNEKKNILESGNFFSWGTEKDILLSRIDENDFHAFLGNLTNLLKEITEALPK